MRDGRVSHTALEVARALVYLGREPTIAPLLPRHAASMTEGLLLATGNLQPWMIDLYNRRGVHAVLELICDAFAKGMIERVGLRKRFVDDEVREAIEQGFEQVLVVGAGFDTLCVRLAAEFPSVTFFEIDHPATQASKRAGIEAIRSARANLVLHGADLGRSSLGDVLRATRRWDPQASTIVIAEGVLMYLERAAVERFFQDVRASTSAESRVVFTYVMCDRSGRAALGRASWLTRGLLAILGEPIRWCVSSEAALRDFLGELGFEYEPDPERFDLGIRYLQPVGLELPGEVTPIEFMALARAR